MTLSLRASRVALARACPPSVQDFDGPRLGSETEVTRQGKALHHLMACAIGSGQFLPPAHVARMFMVDAGELELLFRLCWDCWERVRGDFPEPEVECFLDADLGGILLTGHLDVISWNDPGFDQVRILDWKSGWNDDSGHRDQLLSYAALAMHGCPGVETAHVRLIRPRQGTEESWLYTRNEVDAWVDGLKDRLTGQDANLFHPGAHCGYCPRAATCPAKEAILERTSRALAHHDWQSDALKDWSGSHYICVLDGVRLMEDLCAQARSLIKADVLSRGGRIDTQDGRELVVTEEARETIYLTAEAFDILENIVGVEDHEWKRFVKLSKTDLRKLVMERAPRGRKTIEANQVIDDLRDAGAIENTFIQKLEIRKHEQRDN